MAREPMVYLSVMVPEEMKTELEAVAERTGRSLAEVTRDRLEAGRVRPGEWRETAQDGSATPQ